MSDTMPSFRNMKPHFWVQGGLTALLFLAIIYNYTGDLDYVFNEFTFHPTDDLTGYFFVFIALTFLNFGHALLRKPETDQKSTWPNGPHPPAQ